jgi:type I restriction enzyme S subunit
MDSEFDEIALDDALEFVVDNRGKTVPVCEDGIPLIATNCVSNDDLYPVHSNVRYVSDDIYKNWFRSHPLPNDILLTNKGSKNGAVCLVPDPVDFCIAQDMVALRADPKRIDAAYLFAALRSPQIQYCIKQLNVDSVIPHFKKTDFNKLFIPLPDCNVQKAIGRMYLAFSQRIELNRRMNATLEGMAQALFKSWFVDFDPVIDNALVAGNPIPEEFTARAELRRTALDNGTANRETAKPFPDAFAETEELGWIPDGWEELPLKDVCRVLNGRAYKNSEFKEVGIPIVRIQNLSGGGKTVYSDLALPNDKLISPDDLTFAWSATFGPHIWRGPRSIYHYHIWKMDVDSQRINKFLLYFILQRQTAAMKDAATGSIFTHLTKGTMEKKKIVVPAATLLPLLEQQLSSVFRAISANSSQAVNLTKLRDTLLPKLISGELRIPDAEKLAEAALA